MNFCSVYKLNIFRTGGNCIFQLTGDDGQQISAELPYPEELDRLTEAWQYSYLKAHESPVRGRVEEELSFTPSVDWENRAESAERRLLEKFKRWLRSQELIEIREKIQGAAEEKKVTKKLEKFNDDCVDLLITCNCSELSKLPWEAWKIAPTANIQISRTPLNPGDKAVLVERRGKPRILAIIAATSELNVAEDLRAVRSLKKVAHVEPLDFTLKENSDNYREKLRDKLNDEIGWDVVIFAGHSDETIYEEYQEGRLKLAPDVTISLTEIEFQLTEAIKRGLKVAIFNSCCGTSLAEESIRLGLHQVVAMREKISDRVAHIFLKQFCQSLAMHKNVQQSMQAACEYLQKEKSAYPSAYLIPSLFRHPSDKAKLFRIEPLGFQRWWQNWKPTRKEAIALSTVLFLSILFPVQDLLFDSRTLVQAIYRNRTQQLPQTTSPIQLILIDQESINEAIAEFPDFETYPIDRRYLAELVNRLSDLNFKTVGINYEIYTQEPHQEQLTNALQTAVSEKETWFVFAVNEAKNQKLLPSTASLNWSLQGNLIFFNWDIPYPKDKNCFDTCPFTYWLALSHLLNQDSSLTNLRQPSLKSKTLFSDNIKEFWQQNHPIEKINFNQKYSTLGIRPIIDFSLPPNKVYTKNSARKLLKGDLSYPNSSEQQIAIVASGGYEDADDEDKFSVPLAINYWCNSEKSKSKKVEPCPQFFTGGEINSYITYHLVTPHQVTLIPNWYLIIIAAILGKWHNLLLQQLHPKKKKATILKLTGLTIFLGLGELQLYISASILIPWLLPTFIYLYYLLLSIRRENNE
ncbi:MAG: CHASE2 domain-containing protein [Oscillatoria sp. PMC 1068.18]|nr:CHASE2 domain-containing protein [Oscillatoria sp. PMC 1076.18]MEC4990073.1 CHASE2 domain-containing protein [Oscillatoria sp. PMC 1068.18]